MLTSVIKSLFKKSEEEKNEILFWKYKDLFPSIFIKILRD